MAELQRTLGAWRGTAMMLNIVLGAGLLTLPGLAVQTAGPAALSVWLACALAAVPLLVVFAILGRSFPDAGGLAAFLKQAFGDKGYVCATFLFLGAVAVGLPGIALAGGHYAASVLGGPPAVYAAMLVLGAMLANLASAEIAGRVNAALASVIVLILIGIAVAGWTAVRPGWADLRLIPDVMPTASALGICFMMVFFAFTGWEVSANLGAEFKNPARDFPLAVTASFLVAVALYLVLAVVVIAAGPIGATEAPFATIFARHFGPASAQGIALVSVLLIFANLSAAIWAVSRMVFSASTERLLPSALHALARGAPLRAVVLTTCVLLAVVGLVGFGMLDLGLLLGAAGQNFLLLYAGSAAALIWLGRNPAHRTLGWGCVLMVCAILLFRGAAALIYPASLIAAGILVSAIRTPAPVLATPNPQTSHHPPGAA